MTQLNMRRPVAVVFIIIGVADKGTQGKCKTLAYTLLCGGINMQINYKPIVPLRMFITTSSPQYLATIASANGIEYPIDFPVMRLPSTVTPSPVYSPFPTWNPGKQV